MSCNQHNWIFKNKYDIHCSECGYGLHLPETGNVIIHNPTTISYDEQKPKKSTTPLASYEREYLERLEKMNKNTVQL